MGNALNWTSWARTCASLAAAGCCLSGCAVEAPADEAVVIQFQAKVGAQALQCATALQGLGTDKQSAELADLRFYVHDLALIDSAGVAVAVDLDASPWSTAATVGSVRHQLALLDFEDGKGACVNGSPAVHTAVSGKLTPGHTWKGLQFRLGVPEALNHRDVLTAPAPLNLTSLFWSWLGGYKHLRIDLHTGPAAGWKLHLGATDCDQTAQGTVCTHPNQALIRLENFDWATQDVVLDLAALLSDTALGTEHGGCMADLDDPLCVPLLHALGLPGYATETAAPPQRAFSAAPKG
ncbi:MAG: metallo-mystery pair system four-Cys motif protein [Deltaproteobacteria bacterium]|nr:metallo-mystery pair system four-Cys motif protein [Deltaproteobacteria bacterium]